MKITVLGSGGWGTALSILLHDNGHAVTLWSYEAHETETLRTTHETIGSHLGSPREVITRMLRYFQGEGLVKLSRGQVELTDQKKLAELAGA